MEPACRFRSGRESMTRISLRRTVLRAGTSLMCLFVTSCSSRASDEVRIHTREGVVSVRAEVAVTDAEWKKGLSGRTSLAADAGMAFLHSGPVQTAFWMKDTIIPLSIAFWGGDGRIDTILDMTPCPREPCPVYRPNHSYVGALEVNRGFFERNGVREGDRVELPG
jgi:uncharacterized protein